MKVGIWLNNDYKAEIGGGFSYYSKLVKHIDNYVFNEELEIVFISQNNFKENIKRQQIVLPAILYKRPFLKRIIVKILSFNYYFRRKFRNNYNIKNQKLRNEKWTEILKQNNIKVILYLTQAQKHIENYPFITTNWDIGHKSTYSFPELSENSTYYYREKWYSLLIQQALLIFAESEAGKNELVKLCNIIPEKIEVVPIFSGGLSNLVVEKNEINTFLKKYELTKLKYFFYPAQFWAHKNHYNLILAFKNFLEKNKDYKLIFTGHDYGNLKYIKDIIQKEKLEESIIYLGFRTDKEIKILYENSVSLIMPTFLGPTNMPLLEARELGCPVLCSNLIGHKELMGDGAIYFNPDNQQEIIDAMNYIINPSNRKDILIKANISLTNTSNTVENAVYMIEKHLLNIMPIRNCWY